MKGIFFSLILFFLISMIVSIVWLQRSYVAYTYKQSTLEGRVDAIRNFYVSTAEDSKRAVSIVGKRALAAAISHVISTGSGLSSANETISILLINGTINGNVHMLMLGSTLSDWTRKVKDLGLLQNLNVSIAISNITVLPEDSFTLRVDFRLDINITDENFKISLRKKEMLYSFVDITNFEDPLYPLYTYGRAVNVFIRSPHWLNYSSENLGNLLDALNKSYYHPSKYGGSFLDRLEGKCLVQDKYRIGRDIGLESFVDKQKLLSLGIPVYVNRSNIDYIYFCNISVPAYRISGMPESFRLDNQSTVLGMTHLQIYNVSGRVIS